MVKISRTKLNKESHLLWHHTPQEKIYNLCWVRRRIRVVVLVMPTAWLGSCGPLGWAVFGPARAGKSALAQSQLKLARANRISTKKSARNGLLKTSKNT